MQLTCEAVVIGSSSDLMHDSDPTMDRQSADAMLQVNGIDLFMNTAANHQQLFQSQLTLTASGIT